MEEEGRGDETERERPQYQKDGVKETHEKKNRILKELDSLKIYYANFKILCLVEEIM